MRSGIPEPTPYSRASYDAVDTTARSVGSPRPPTIIGLPASSGCRSTSTAAMNWSRSTWSTHRAGSSLMRPVWGAPATRARPCRSFSSRKAADDLGVVWGHSAVASACRVDRTAAVQAQSHEGCRSADVSKNPRVDDSGPTEMVAMTHFGFLSTYPPTRCGLATFTEALASSLVEVGEREPTIVRILDVRESGTAPAVFGRVPTTTELISGNRVSMRASVRALETCDVAIVQHEFGIYGGSDGDEIIPLLRSLSTPVIVVLHTVLMEPTPHQRNVLDTVCRLAVS